MRQVGVLQPLGGHAMYFYQLAGFCVHFHFFTKCHPRTERFWTAKSLLQPRGLYRARWNGPGQRRKTISDKATHKRPYTCWPACGQTCPKSASPDGFMRGAQCNRECRYGRMCMNCFQTWCRVDWLWILWLIGWFVDRVTGWLIDQSVDWSIDRLVDDGF